MKKEILNKLTYLYFIIPTIIFLLGWCKIYIATPLVIALVCIYIKRYRLKKNTIVKLKEYVKKNKKEIICLLLIACGFVFISGIGGFVFQNSDHLYRNALFEELVNKKWPVVYESTANFESEFFLVYYFAFWLPSALVGKMFGITIGNIFLYFWSVLGVSILFAYFSIYYKKNYLVPILIFILFSGLDIVMKFLYGGDVLSLINSTTHLEWTTEFQFSAFTTQLFWVFNQALPAWLFTFYILNEKNNRIIGIILAISLIFCTLPAVGLIFVALYKALFENNKIIKMKRKTEFKKWIIETFTWENIIVGIPLLIIFALFVKSNLAGSILSLNLNKFNILPILVTIFFEFIIYYILIYKYQKKSPLFYISLISLIICPLISINGGGDFCMRASIPGLIMLFIMILQSLDESQKKQDKKFEKILIVLLAIGSITPINEIKRTISSTNEYTKIEKTNLITCAHQKNFFGYTKDSLFYKYIAKK